ncbi:MAG: cupin domain-containing protein [bacterium]|nr:cupin domain-containing protein [bacterium]
MKKLNKKDVIFVLKDSIKYQKDTIVSKQIINKKTGTLTLFAFDKNQSLSEHTAPFDAFVYIIDGCCEITISGRMHRLKKGDAIIMPKNKPHALKAISKFKMMLVMIR